MAKEYIALREGFLVGTRAGGSEVAHYEPGEKVPGAEHFANLQGLVDGGWLAEAGSPAAKAFDARAAEASAASSGPTKDELYERATQLDIPGRSSMSKDELAAAIAAAEAAGS